MGAEFFRWEFATAVAGIGLRVDPFDEPDVEASKENTAEMLEAYRKEGTLPHAEPVASRGVLRVWRQGGGSADFIALLREHIARTPETGYFQIGAYFAPTEARTTALRALQHDLRDGTRKAATMGYGPRFLHSTGQLHKGGAPIGCFFQLTAGRTADVPIPGQERDVRRAHRCPGPG